jgi:hypothetical protein
LSAARAAANQAANASLHDTGLDLPPARIPMNLTTDSGVFVGQFRKDVM